MISAIKESKYSHMFYFDDVNSTHVFLETIYWRSFYRHNDDRHGSGDHAEKSYLQEL